MNDLKNYRENFYFYFEKDKGKMILDLLDEAKLNNEIIQNKANLIRNKLEEITNLTQGLFKDEIPELERKNKDFIPSC